jgi:hypothetical protein
MTFPVFNVGDVLTAADMNAVGLWKVSDTTFTTATGHNVDNCFTSDFANYRFLLDISALSATDTVIWQWRTGGTSGSTYTTADYDYQLQESAGATTTAQASMAQNHSRICFGVTTPGYVSASFDLFNPQTAFRATWSGTGMSPNGTTNVILDDMVGANRVTTAFTGIRISTIGGTATMTGRLRIYGYRN